MSNRMHRIRSSAARTRWACRRRKKQISSTTASRNRAGDWQYNISVMEACPSLYRQFLPRRMYLPSGPASTVPCSTARRPRSHTCWMEPRVVKPS